ncbi:MAG: menaquinone biosynthesis protein [Candidatus Latescibacteria bacterium]|jgi:chorismate dehydratase|nr:menaquinone biosynthesis protein [Candidatus Latescibacterota bacterium]
MTRLRVVRYLNTTPLVHAFQKGLIDHDFDLAYDVPSECASKLDQGISDLGIIPSIEYARRKPPYRIVPDISISSKGPVGSIFLFHRGALARIESVALDTSSRTSVALAQVILKDKYGLDIVAVPHPPDLDAMLESADAALVIGDPALEYTDRPEDRLDLGREWTELTGLPFVYAFWAGHEGAVSKDEVRKLIKSKDLGLDCLGEIANEYAVTHRHPVSLYKAYLSDHLQYPFGPDEQAGLKEFYRRAHRIGLIESEPALRFYET